MTGDDFMALYREYAEPLTDAPLGYHELVGLSILSATLGNRVYLPFGRMRIYPNIWTVLIAPSSLFRKTTSINIGMHLLRNICPDAIFPNEITPEALTDLLASKAQGIFVWSEFAGFLSALEKNYMFGIKELLTDLYDAPPVYIRKIRSEIKKIEDPCISILTATTMDWFLDKIKEGDIRGGFLARFVYLPASAKTKWLALPPSPDKAKEEALKLRLKQLSTIKGEVKFKDVEKKYTNWLKKHESQLETQTDNQNLAGFYTRLGIYALKFAILYQIGANNSLVIKGEVLDQATQLVDHLKMNITKILTTEVAFNQSMKNKNRVLRIIKDNPGIEYRKLLQNSNLYARDLRPVLDTLLAEESVKINKNGSKSKYFNNKENSC